MLSTSGKNPAENHTYVFSAYPPSTPAGAISVSQHVLELCLNIEKASNKIVLKNSIVY